MTHSINTGDRWLRMAVGIAAVTVLSGCYDDAVTDVTGEQPAVNVTLAPGTAVLPAGSLESAGLQILNAEGFDLSIPDAFARANEPLGRYIEQPETGFGSSFGFDVLSAVAGSNVDPRLPEPTAETVAGGEFFGLFNPVFTNVGEGWWDLFGELSGLNASSTYTVVLARMALDVRGTVDHSQILLGEPVEEPDSLFFLGGSEVGYAGVTCNFTSGTPVTAETNPVALGVVDTNAEGEATVDCLPVAINDSPWWRSMESADPPPAGAEDSVPVGVNNLDGGVEPGMFNYVLLYEGAIDPANPVPDGAPAARFQIGPDIDSEGNVIENAFAPFPAGETDPSEFSSLPGAGDAFVAPTVLNLSFSGLPALGSGGTYAAYLFDAEAESFALLGTFESEGPAEETVVSFSEEETGFDFSQFNEVYVSIEAGAPGAAPSDARFLVREFLSPDNALTQLGSFTFGSANVTPAEEFEITGVGTATFIRDSLLVQLRRLDDPPAGFHYQSYLLDGTPDEFESEVRLHTIEVNELGNAVDRIGEDEVGSFANYNTYVVALEPDVAPGLTPAFIQVSEDYIDEFGEEYFLNGTGDDGDNGNGNGDT